MNSNTLGCIIGFIIFVGTIAAVIIPFEIERQKYKKQHYVQCYKCDKWHQKGDFYCTDCHIRIAGPCPNCGVDQKWRGSGCTQCGYNLTTGEVVSLPSPVNVRTTPIPPTIPGRPAATLYLSCPHCGRETPQGSTFCGSCGANLELNLEQTIIHEQDPGPKHP